VSKCLPSYADIAQYSRHVSKVPRRDSCAAAKRRPIRSPANAADALFGKECEGLPTRPLGPAGRSLRAAAGASRTPPSQIVTRTRCSSIPGADTKKSRRVHAGHLEGCSAPPIDPHRGTFLDLRASVDRRSATTSSLNGSLISTSGAPACTKVLDATFMQASSTILSRRRAYRREGEGAESTSCLRWSCRAFWSSMKLGWHSNFIPCGRR
jgi:hypothetical protein